MGTFNTKTILNGNPSLILAIADRICQEFAADGYEINREDLVSGGVDISVTKGGIFKAVLGMKTALKVTLIPQNDCISFDAGVGIFGQQAIPTVIMLFFAWPVLLTQIWGLIQQADLDDKALAAAQAVIAQSYTTTSINIGFTKFCTNCGNQVDVLAKYCSNCGNPLI